MPTRPLLESHGDHQLDTNSRAGTDDVTAEPNG
jgi:hypothetical protein